MKTELIRIGNSRGVRIPKPLIEQCQLGRKVELRVEDGHLILSPERKPRQGWAEKFNAAGGEDEVLLAAMPASRFDRKEWKW